MKIAKNILFILVFCLMFLPLIQHVTGVFNIRPLKGSYSKQVLPKFSWKAYINDEFQPVLNKWIEENIGLRPFFIRVNNQIAYSLYDTALANSVIIGKKNYLYEKNYIKAYLGWDFIGKNLINEKAGKLQYIQKQLMKDSVHLLIIFAPGKASFFPEYIPKKFNPENRTITNYEYMKLSFNKMNINFIDFNDYFIQLKDTIRYPLFPQYGIHWSTYGAYMVYDSLLSYIEDKIGKDLPDVIYQNIELSSKLKDNDYDIADGMNLLFRISTYKMAYPKIKIEKKDKYHPNVITVADSYYWNIFGKGLTANAFDNNSFWYYFKEAYNPRYEGGKKPFEEIDILHELRNQDIVILLSTDANLYKFAFGFIDKVYSLLQKEDDIMNRN